MELVGGIKRPLGRGKVSGVAGRDDGGVGCWWRWEGRQWKGCKGGGGGGGGAEGLVKWGRMSSENFIVNMV